MAEPEAVSVTAPEPLAIRPTAPVPAMEPVTVIPPLLLVPSATVVPEAAPLTVRLVPEFAFNVPADKVPPRFIAVDEDKVAVPLIVTTPDDVSELPPVAVRPAAETFPPRVRAPAEPSSMVAALTDPLVVREPAEEMFRSDPALLFVRVTADATSVTAAELEVLTVKVGAFADATLTAPLPDCRVRVVPADTCDP